MSQDIADLYSDYLLSSFGPTTATGLSALLEGAISHDQVTRMLAKKKLTSRDWWLYVKPYVRKIQSKDGVLIVDDSIEEKPYTDENDIVCWHYDHAKGRAVKGINFVTALYHAQGISLPVGFEIVSKTEWFVDKKTGKRRRKSKETKNERYRRLVKQAVDNEIPFRYVLNDIWFASAENMRFVKLDLGKDFIMGMKENRKVALSEEAKSQGQYQRIKDLDWPEDMPVLVYLEGVSFPLYAIRQVFKNEDGSTGIRYLVTSDLSLTAGQIATIYQKRWNVEEYHRSLKQNASLAKSPTRTETTQTNHFVAALRAYVKLEWLKVKRSRNHYQLKSQLYLKALQQAFNELQSLQQQLALQPLAA